MFQWSKCQVRVAIVAFLSYLVGVHSTFLTNFIGTVGLHSVEQSVKLHGPPSSYWKHLHQKLQTVCLSVCIEIFIFYLWCSIPRWFQCWTMKNDVRFCLFLVFRCSVPFKCNMLSDILSTVQSHYFWLATFHLWVNYMYRPNRTTICCDYWPLWFLAVQVHLNVPCISFYPSMPTFAVI